MRKLIDIPDEVLKALKALADKEKRNLKNYIELVLEQHARSNKKKK